jgi:hypothetical protein
VSSNYAPPPVTQAGVYKSKLKFKNKIETAGPTSGQVVADSSDIPEAATASSVDPRKGAVGSVDAAPKKQLRIEAATRSNPAKEATLTTTVTSIAVTEATQEKERAEDSRGRSEEKDSAEDSRGQATPDR